MSTVIHKCIENCTQMKTNRQQAAPLTLFHLLITGD